MVNKALCLKCLFMAIINYLWLTIMFCTIPAGVLWLCRKYSWLDKIGPVMILYAIGLVIANIPMPAEIAKIQGIIPTIMIPLAIPMMLFGCTFKTSEVSLQLRVVTSGVISVCIAVVGGYLLFGQGIPQGEDSILHGALPCACDHRRTSVGVKIKYRPVRGSACCLSFLF